MHPEACVRLPKRPEVEGDRGGADRYGRRPKIPKEIRHRLECREGANDLLKVPAWAASCMTEGNGRPNGTLQHRTAVFRVGQCSFCLLSVSLSFRQQSTLVALSAEESQEDVTSRLQYSIPHLEPKYRIGWLRDPDADLAFSSTLLFGTASCECPSVESSRSAYVPQKV